MTQPGAVLDAPTDARPGIVRPAGRGLLLPDRLDPAGGESPRSPAGSNRLVVMKGQTPGRSEPGAQLTPYFFTRTQPFDSAPDARLFVQGTELTGHIRKGREHLRIEVMDKARERGPFQRRLLAWMRDHWNRDIPRVYYQLVLGHDLHVSTYAMLHVRHFHTDQRDPFTGKWGWLEDLGLVSPRKVSQAFIEFEALNLVTDSTTYGDFKHHEVGTDATAEANTQSALIAPTGIARVAGTQTNPTAATFRSVATVVADAAEVWTEHLLANDPTAGVGMDRSLMSPTATVVPTDTVQFTYTLTKNPEA